MKKSTIKDAIIEVLEKSKQGLSAKEICNKIMELNLYTFNSASPISMVNSAIRKSCEGIDLKKSNPVRVFKVSVEGKYTLAIKG